MRSICPAIVLIRSRIWAFNWYQYRWPEWPWTAKCPLFCIISPNVALKQLLGLSRFQNLLLIVYDHINTICPKQPLITRFDGRRCIDDWVHCIDYHWRLVIVEIRNLGTQFNGRRLWPLHVQCRRKTFTFAISSSDELLLTFGMR